ncbi:hypothetical protein CH340_00720 [Rhodoplanes serenus]|nr:hypothetical protein CH340_00720 [Rhodoplanes serenus]
MQIMQAPDDATCLSAPPDALCSLVRQVGKPAFVGALLASSRVFAPVEFVSIFLYPNKNTPIFVGTEGPAGRRYASSAADHYMARHYRDDPNLGIMFEHGGVDGSRITYVSRDDIPTVGYRTWCYDRAHIADRLSLVGRTERGLSFSVSFYGGRETGVLSESSRRALAAFFPIVRAVALRHFELWRNGGIDPVTTRVRVLERFPMLSPREADVAAGVVAGMTAEEIGGWLGIAPTSVITHRKRAYERVAVANQREFLRVFYGS